MVAKPWENRLMEKEKASTDSDITTPFINIKECNKLNLSRLSEPSTVKVKKNSMTKRISARPPLFTHASSSPSYDESSASSSIFTTTTPISDESNCSRPNYMNLTEATKAKQRRNTAQRQPSMDESQFLNKSMAFANADSKSSSTILTTRVEKFNRGEGFF